MKTKDLLIGFLCFVVVIIGMVIWRMGTMPLIHAPTERLSNRAQGIVFDINAFHEQYGYYPFHEPTEIGGGSYDMIALANDETFTGGYFGRRGYYCNPGDDIVVKDYWGIPYNIGIRGVTMSTNLFNVFFGEDEGDVIVWSSGENMINEYGQGDDILNRKTKKEELRIEKFHRNAFWDLSIR